MIFLAPFGWLYGRLMQVRNALYDRGIFKSYDLGAKTISVGNVTTGGTGKTPIVALIAEILAGNGDKVCILTRGYGRKNENERVLVSDGENVLVDAEIGGDEPTELSRKLIGKAIVVAEADRVAAAEWARSQFEITCFVLDDAFQHRRAKRDLDIVCVDATVPFGNGKNLPVGRLREPVRSLERADAVVITRSDQSDNLGGLNDDLRSQNNKIPIFKGTISINRIVTLEEFRARSPKSQREALRDVTAFTGIANPQNFFKSLETFGIRPVAERPFKDHFKYTKTNIEEIEVWARSKKSACLITTAKDAVKLEKFEFSLPCYVAEIETVIDDPVRFRDLVLSV